MNTKSLLLWIFITTGVTGCNPSRQPSSETSGAPNAGDIDGASTGKPKGGGVIAAVQQGITSDPRIKSKEIQVRFERGTVKLTGTVASEEEAAAVGSHAMEVAGVEGVANHLLYPVGPHGGSSNQKVPTQDVIDAAIDAALEKIHSDPNIKGVIEVRFSHFGLVMQLTGKVDTEDQRTAVLNDAIKVTDLGVGSSVGCVCADEPSFFSLFSEPAPPWTGPPMPSEPIVPLCPGLTVVTAVAQPQGDYESIKTIEAADSRQVRLKYSAELMQSWWDHPHPELVRTITHRTILTSELESAHRYNQLFVGGENSTESASGATAIGTSAAVLKELKTTGESGLSLCGATGTGGCYNFTDMILKRVGNEPVRVRVLMNGVPVDLPAVHARGEIGQDRDEFFFLDDERNPLTLAFRLGIGVIPALPPSVHEGCETLGKQGRYGLDGYSCDLPNGGDRDVLRAIKIETKCESVAARSRGGNGGPAGGGADALEKSLSESGTVDVYSIYFSFNSDEIRDESEPTFKEIAEVLRKHTDWKLRIVGHTDGIGSQEKNLDLSKRRAGAVKDALVKRYKIDAGRLSTTGFGKSQPKDTNDTIEGRARNRRVELMKVGP